RLFLALKPAGISVQQDQDRRLVHQVGQFQREGGDHRPRRARPWTWTWFAGAGGMRRDGCRASVPAGLTLRSGAVLSIGTPGRNRKFPRSNAWGRGVGPERRSCV